MNLPLARTAPLLLAVTLLAACTAARKQQMLTLFFDGVPSPKPPAAAPSPAAPAPVTENQLPDLYLAARAAPAGVRHQPYAERQCTSCHESQFSEKLRGGVAELCQICHKNVFEPRRFEHTPVATGDCGSCHHPHESLQPALLLQPARQVCAECHEEERVFRTPAHRKPGAEACLACHDPHGGPQRYFLRPGKPPAAAPIKNGTAGQPLAALPAATPLATPGATGALR